MNNPQLLYRYRAINNYTLTELIDDKFYFASPNDFNDPFDCKNITNINKLPKTELSNILSVYLKYILPNRAQKDLIALNKDLLYGKNNHRRELRLNEFIEHINAVMSDYGVLCMSKISNDILMWSHYADSHRGICIIYDKSELKKISKIRNVVYSYKYPTFTSYIKNKINLEPLILNKSLHWEYEKESRLIIKPDHLYKTSMNRLIDIPGDALIGIVFGCQISTEDKKMIKDIFERKKKVINFYQARKSENAYSLLIDSESQLFSWVQLPPLPYGVQYPDDIISYNNPDTPEEVYAKYAGMWSPGDMLVWATGQYCGIKIDDYELVWHPEELQHASISLSERQGWNDFYEFTICVKGKVLVLFTAYNPREYNLLSWFKVIALSLNKLFGVNFKEEEYR